jgi:hypothetical protein
MKSFPTTICVLRALYGAETTERNWTMANYLAAKLGTAREALGL